jgi:polyisoprenoid-binding protein YceI
MKTRPIAKTCALTLISAAASLACDSKSEPASERTAPPELATAKAAASAAPVSAESSLKIASEGMASFLIDAPLEKIKGKANKFGGAFTLNHDDIRKSTGQVEVDLKSLETHTFDDEDKNATQTGHAHNWMELGDDVDPKQREENRWVRFTIRSIESEASRLADLEVIDGERKAEVMATGDLWLHGISEPKKIPLIVTFVGAEVPPRSVRVATKSPLEISLAKHDIKPRDLAGRFLQGALEKVGDKIVDNVQVSFEFTAEVANQ